MEMIVVMGVAVLLFGKRLPEVGRSLGKGIVEFKKGLRGMEDEFDFTRPRPLTSPARRYEDDPLAPTTVRRVLGPQVRAPDLRPDPRMDYEPQPTQD